MDVPAGVRGLFAQAVWGAYSPALPSSPLPPYPFPLACAVIAECLLSVLHVNCLPRTVAHHMRRRTLRSYWVVQRPA